MDQTINIGVTGALLSVFIDAIKATGKLPSNYIPLANVILSALIAIALTWDSFSMLSFVFNWATIVLAAAGTYELRPKRGTGATDSTPQ